MIRKMKEWKLTDHLVKLINQILVGHYHYYGITDNGRSLYNMQYRVERMLFFFGSTDEVRKEATFTLWIPRTLYDRERLPVYLIRFFKIERR